MKCINCVYYPCLRIECEPGSNCDYYKNIVEAEIEGIDNRFFKIINRHNERRNNGNY